MTPLLAILAAGMGVVLGLLGGGGSILAVPLLVYVAGLGAKEAIATSLLVVGVTAAVATVRHARSGHVRWRLGAVFGLTAMAGAYAAGLAAWWFSGDTLLLLFALLTLAAGVAMLRPRKPPEASAPVLVERSLWWAAVEGVVVGGATGLVGAGGGFLVVPALVLLGGLDMRSAVGTSSLVITLKALAGFAGHASHVVVDPALAAGVIAFAVLGVVAGVALARRVEAGRLRTAFGAFVVAMALVLLARHSPPELVRAFLVDRWPFWAGGLAVGAFVLVFLAATGKALGVSTGYLDACAAPFDPAARRSWRLPFLVGIVGGGLLSAWGAGGPALTATAGMFDALAPASLPARAALFAGGGVLLGLGARLAGGCTSGHGIVGVGQLARSSLLATAVFMATGVVVTHLLFSGLGG